MKSVTKVIVASLVLSTFAFIAVLTLGHSTVSAEAAPLAVPAASSSSGTSTANYNYVAQPGDAYTLMARKAIQTYGITSKVNLSPAQIIYAETNLTQKAGSPQLLVGQKVQINGDSVKQWVESAQKLSATQQASWNVYAANANFNTNAVGQAK